MDNYLKIISVSPSYLEHCLAIPILKFLRYYCLQFSVEEPCQLGCSGLSYCTNFNNRPTEHFRSCTQEADLAARSDFLDWQKGTISLPRKLFIPVKGKVLYLFRQIQSLFPSKTIPNI